MPNETTHKLDQYVANKDLRREIESVLDSYIPTHHDVDTNKGQKKYRADIVGALLITWGVRKILRTPCDCPDCKKEHELNNLMYEIDKVSSICQGVLADELMKSMQRILK